MKFALKWNNVSGGKPLIPHITVKALNALKPQGMKRKYTKGCCNEAQKNREKN